VAVHGDAGFEGDIPRYGGQILAPAQSDWLLFRREETMERIQKKRKKYKMKKWKKIK
jgi:hypothetical protein